MAVRTLSRVCLLMFLVQMVLGSLESDIATQMNGTSRSLSRKRRYLVFPEGSSLQLVFCLTYPSVGVGAIFVFGSTAALAWELPHDPFLPFKKHADALHRIDTKVDGNSWAKTKTKTAPITLHNNKKKNSYNYSKLPSLLYSTIKNLQSPAPKKTYNALSTFGTKYDEYFRSAKQPIDTYVDPVFHEVHRRTRRELFGKIEKLFKAQNKDGRACLLKAICEVHQAPKGKGSFMHEIMKTIFRPKPHDEYEDEDHYDLAANKYHDCNAQYPSCPSSIWNI